jgi:hypothetical protein
MKSREEEDDGIMDDEPKGRLNGCWTADKKRKVVTQTGQH